MIVPPRSEVRLKQFLFRSRWSCQSSLIHEVLAAPARRTVAFDTPQFKLRHSHFFDSRRGPEYCGLFVTRSFSYKSWFF